MTFHEFCRTYGVHVPLTVEPGKWIRCSTDSHPRKKNASIKLGDDLQHGFVHDWATMDEAVLWRANGVQKAPEIDQREIESRRVQREKEYQYAADLAYRYYDRCQPFRKSHPYLDRKGLTATGCEGLRVDGEGYLIVPIKVGAEFSSIQKISPDGTKLFWPGARTKGAAFGIRRRNSTVLAFCEGLATALTVFAAIPESTVIVGFNAGNLHNIVFKPSYGIVIVCADNDWETADRIGKNPGIEGAKKAAEKIGARVAIPNVSEGHSDFNDYFAECVEKRESDRMLARFKVSDAKIRQLALADVKTAIMRS